MDIFNELMTMKTEDASAWVIDQSSLSSVMRCNVAEDLIEEARACFAQDQGIANALILIQKAIVLAPAMLLPYFYLWRFLLKLGVSPQTQIAVLRETAGRFGCNDERSHAFINALVGGSYAFLDELLEDETTCDVANRLVLYVADDLRFEDVFLIDAQRDLHYLGRVEQPTLIYSPVHHDHLSANAQIVAEEMIKRGKDHRVVYHCGTGLFVESRAIFGPSIDTLLFNQLLHAQVLGHEAFRSTIRTSVEVGVGSGFLMLTTLRRLMDRGGVRCFGFDISPEACAHSERAANALITKMAATHAAVPRVTIGLDARGLACFADGEVDFAYSNPPYLPYASAAGEPPLHGAIEGFDIYEQFLISEGPRVLNRKTGVLLLLYSSLAHEPVQALLRQTPLCYEAVGQPLTVPLDLFEVASNPAWSTLIRKNSGLIRDYASRFKVRAHTLQVFAAYWPDHVLRDSNTGRIFS